MKLLFPGTNAFLEIDVLSYEHSTSTQLGDLNWLSCKVCCQIDSLRVNEIISLETYDFIELQKSIINFNQNNTSKIHFTTLENQLQFTIQRERSTHITIKGTLSAMLPIRGVFTFEFEAETLFFSTIESLENILLNFPVRGELNS